MAAAGDESAHGAHRVAMVTGATRGIGRAIALSLATSGFDIVAVGRTAPALHSLGDEVRLRGGSSLAIHGDLVDAAFPAAAAAAALAWQGRVDVLVNAAGIINRRDPPDVTASDFDAVFSVNVRAPLLLAQAVHGALARRRGSIVNVASLAGETVTRAAVTYQASKAALIQMTRALAVRWGPEVRVNAVGPGYIETDLNREWLADPDNRGYIERSTSLQRLGTPADVTGAVTFLTSPAAEYITGQHIVIDGGWHTP